MQLRGFDTYDVSLGDEMRGERASMNKSLEQVETDLHIKGRLIAAIEDCDLSAFPNHSVVAGYVRCYARYLGMDVETCYQRFCAESGFQSPVAMIAGGAPLTGSGLSTDPLNSAAGSQIGKSRFAAPPIPRGFSARISLGGLVSSTVLVTIIAGLSYGGYALLQDIQRVGFAPLVEAPDIVADAPLIEVPKVEAALKRPDAAAYTGDGALAGLSPALYPRRDGPISAIDPASYGVFARPETEIATREGVESGVVDSADDAIAAERLHGREHDGIAGPLAQAPQADPLPSQSGMTLHAVEEAWVRVRDGGNVTLFEAVMTPGERFALPPLAIDPVLRSGNPGGVYVTLDGITYGPVGPRGAPRNVSLSADEIRSNFPRAEISFAAEPDQGDGPVEQRAAVDLD